MSRFFKGIIIAVLALFAMGTLTACSTTEPVDMSKVTAVIDVRTPAEFAEGHLQGAVNMDVESPLFTEQVSQLDKTGTFVVYCRSGNRSKAAIDTMKGLGFTTLINGGGYSDASKMTGLPIVK